MKNLYDANDWTDIAHPQKIGEILMQAGLMNLVQLDMALNVQKIRYSPIGEILVQMRVITAEQLNSALELQQKINEKFV